MSLSASNFVDLCRKSLQLRPWGHRESRRAGRMHHHGRIAVVPVTPGTGSRSLAAFIRDLSPRGMQLIMKQPLAPGMQLLVILPNPPTESLNILCRVVHCKEANAGFSSSVLKLNARPEHVVGRKNCPTALSCAAIMIFNKDLITAAVGPVVIMSSCGLLCSTFYNRMSNVITRLRAFQRERLAEQNALDKEMHEAIRAHRREMLDVLGRQTNMMIRRVRLIRWTLFCLLMTIIALAACSLVLGLSTLLSGLIYVAIILFILGLCLLITGLVFAMKDLSLALDPVVLETTFVTRRLRGDEGV